MIGNIISLMFPDKETRSAFRLFCREVDAKLRTQKIKGRYPELIKKIRDLPKIKVLFLVNEASKWKMQSLYDLMSEDEKFEPVVALTIADIQSRMPKSEQVRILEDNYEFFAKKGLKCVYAYDFKTKKPKSLEEFNPHIVFYQQPWRIAHIQMPYNVSKYALTCYVPYYVPNYGSFRMDCDKELHKSVWKYYVLNKDWEELFKNHIKDNVSEILGLGHPMLDIFYLNKDYKATKDYVIYAPHWSVDHPKNNNTENYSTFNLNGKEILEYAKAHPEINWVFKPHPSLRFTLIRTGIMSEREVDDYYKQWEEIAESCYTSDYAKLFLESKALITDCGSFLTEYFCTGKPLIHLISPTCKLKPMEPSKKFFNTFYKVKNFDDMYDIFDRILLQGKDDKKEERTAMLKECGFTDNYAAENILNDLKTYTELRNDN